LHFARFKLVSCCQKQTNLQRAFFCLLAALFLCSAGRRGIALPTFPAVVDSTYQPTAGGNIATKATQCTLCHVAAGPPKLNPYGADVKLALDVHKSKMLTPAILHERESKDSDRDGWTNGQEFAADTLPGDAVSKPKGMPPMVKPIAADAAADKPFSLIAGIKAFLFPKHAQHPAIVHFPIALYYVSLLFDLLAWRRQDRILAAAAKFNLILAAISSLFSVATGLLAWQFAYGGVALQGMILYHLVFGIVTAVGILAMCWMRTRKSVGNNLVPGKFYLAFGLVLAVVVMITGHLGGNLTGVN